MDASTPAEQATSPIYNSRIKAFTELFHLLEEMTNNSEKTRASVRYFSTIAAADGAWAVYFLAENDANDALNS